MILLTNQYQYIDYEFELKNHFFAIIVTRITNTNLTKQERSKWFQIYSLSSLHALGYVCLFVCLFIFCRLCDIHWWYLNSQKCCLVTVTYKLRSNYLIWFWIFSLFQVSSVYCHLQCVFWEASSFRDDRSPQKTFVELSPMVVIMVSTLSYIYSNLQWFIIFFLYNESTWQHDVTLPEI